MKDILNRLLAPRKSGDNMQETTLLQTSKQNVTPEWIDTLKENEIFVFGCRNSGRHFDGASNFALEHFGAVMGQREGRQGQSYAIPTIGGTIGLREIRQSVKNFTTYAAEYPNLHFLVTPIGCGGGCRSVEDIAPMFQDAAELPNVSLPQSFWNVLKLQDIKRPSMFHHPSTLYEQLMVEYKYDDKDYYFRTLCEKPLIVNFKHKHSHQVYVVNVDKKKVVEMVDKDGHVKMFSRENLHYSINYTPYYDQLSACYAPYGLHVWGFYESGLSVVRWGVGGLDKFGCPTHYVDGYIDTDFRVIEPFQVAANPFDPTLLEWVECQMWRKKDDPSIW